MSMQQNKHIKNYFIAMGLSCNWLTERAGNQYGKVAEEYAKQFREALSFCLAAFYEAKPDHVSEEFTDTLTQVCGMFVAGLECKLFDDDEEES